MKPMASPRSLCWTRAVQRYVIRTGYALSTWYELGGRFSVYWRALPCLMLRWLFVCGVKRSSVGGVWFKFDARLVAFAFRNLASMAPPSGGVSGNHVRSSGTYDGMPQVSVMIDTREPSSGLGACHSTPSHLINGVLWASGAPRQSEEQGGFCQTPLDVSVVITIIDTRQLQAQDMTAILDKTSQADQAHAVRKTTPRDGLERSQNVVAVSSSSVLLIVQCGFRSVAHRTVCKWMRTRPATTPRQPSTKQDNTKT